MGNLSTKAMLVSLTLTAWTARKYDKKVSKEVADAHNADTHVGRYNKNLLPVDAPSYKAVQHALNATRIYHYEQTLPWSNDGARILPALNYLEYTQGLRRKFSAIDNAVSDFVDDYPKLVANAQRTLNGLFRQEDYPSQADLRKRFTRETKILPLPDAYDFRVSLNDEDIASIRDAIERDTNASVEQAMRDLYDRLHAAVSRMVERLSDTEAVFRDSLVQNIRELCDIMPRLNLTGDTTLDELRARVEAELTEFEPNELRESKALRAEIARKAAKIQNDMQAFMGVSNDVA